MLRALARYVRRDGTVLVVGHEPGLSRLASLLLTGSIDGLGMKLKKGGLISIEMQGTPPHAKTTLRWMLTPRQLRVAGR
jgi:phosphohistidine phosphatase SixA